MLTYASHQVTLQGRLVDALTILEHHQGQRHLPFDLIMYANDRTLGHGRMTSDQILHFPRGQPMPGNVDDIVGAPHDVDEAIVIQIAAVAGMVVARISGEVRLQVALVVAPQRLTAARRQGQSNDDGTLLVGAKQVTVVIEHPHVVTRYCAVAGTRTCRATFQTDAGRGDRPAGFGLPPVVMDGLAAGRFQPLMRAGIKLLARQKQLAQGAQVITAHQLAVGVFLTNRAHGRRRTKQAINPVLLDHPPIRARIRRADRFTLIEHRGAAAHQRAVDDQGMANHPADIRYPPPYIPRLHPIDMAHGKAQGYRIAAVFADDALGFSGRA
ncbi:hypothetical protein D3C78_816010 [compost metagenome]